VEFKQGVVGFLFFENEKENLPRSEFLRACARIKKSNVADFFGNAPKTELRGIF